MSEDEDFIARIAILIQGAQIKLGGGQIAIDVPSIEVVLPREDCTEITRRMMPGKLTFPPVVFGLGQRITGRVSNLREIALDYAGNEIHFHARPNYRVQLDQKLPALGWKKVAAISGKIEIPGLIRFRLNNPGAPLPDVEICYEIVPGVPDILNIPDWAETTFKPEGKNLRDTIRELLSRQQLIRPFAHFGEAAVLRQVQIRELTMTTDPESVHLDFAVAAQMEH